MQLMFFLGNKWISFAWYYTMIDLFAFIQFLRSCTNLCHINHVFYGLAGSAPQLAYHLGFAVGELELSFSC
jgi:hypothetical protein